MTGNPTQIKWSLPATIKDRKQLSDGTRSLALKLHCTSCALITRLLFAVFVFQMTLTSESHADTVTCPEWATPDAPRVDRVHRRRSSDGQIYNKGPLFETHSYHWTRGIWFKMPLGFRNPWVSKSRAETLTDKDAYKRELAQKGFVGFDSNTASSDPKLVTSQHNGAGFSFWMPSGRYVERNRSTAMNMRPCEAGRLPPTGDDYVVFFTIEWPFAPGSAEADDTRGFRIIEESQARGENNFYRGSPSEENTLDGPITGFRRYHIFNDDGDLGVRFLCSPFLGKDTPPNPICSGLIWLRSKDLVLYIRFPSDRGQLGNEERWRTPVFAAIEKAISWRIKE